MHVLTAIGLERCAFAANLHWGVTLLLEGFIGVQATLLGCWSSSFAQPSILYQLLWKKEKRELERRRTTERRDYTKRHIAQRRLLRAAAASAPLLLASSLIVD